MKRLTPIAFIAVLLPALTVQAEWRPIEEFMNLPVENAQKATQPPTYDAKIYHECLFKHIGDAHTDLAVRLVGDMCQQKASE